MATLADGTTVNQQQSEGWNITRLNPSLRQSEGWNFARFSGSEQWSEDWNMNFILVSDFDLTVGSALAPPITPGEPVNIEGTVLRNDGAAAPATIVVTDPDGNTTSWSADVAKDGSFSETYTPEKTGTYTVLGENDLPEKQSSENWNFDRFSGSRVTTANWNFDRFSGSLVHDEGWNSK